MCEAVAHVVPFNNAPETTWAMTMTMASDKSLITFYYVFAIVDGMGGLWPANVYFL